MIESIEEGSYSNRTMKKFYYYNSKDWTARQQCLLDPVEPIFVVEAESILDADKAFQQATQTNPVTTKYISVTLAPLGAK